MRARRELVAPAGEQIVIGPRDAEHFADDLHRIVIGELRHELAGSAGCERVHELIHDVAHRVPVTAAARGVNDRLTRRRKRVWSSPSVAMTDAANMS